MWRNRITEQNQNGREEIAQIIEEHIDFMTRRYRETGSVFKSIVTKIGFFPYMECFEKVLMDKDWDRLNNLIYQENCFRSLWALMCGETHYSAFLDMLDALAVGNMKTLDLLVPHKTEPITNIFPAYGPARRFYIKRGYIPDGKGVYYKEKACETDAACRNDDELTLWLAKEL